MMRCLKQSFFNRPTITVARELLGKYLVRRHRGKTIAGMITEVEVYDGFKDTASHASRGLTKRNFPMFGPAGYWYVYLVYGMYWMLNIVTRENGYPAAILIRGIQSKDIRCPYVIKGPGRVTKYFQINKRFNEMKADKKTGLWIEDGLARRNFSESEEAKISKMRIVKSKRIGVAYAGPVWANKKYRFYIK